MESNRSAHGNMSGVKFTLDMQGDISGHEGIIPTYFTKLHPLAGTHQQRALVFDSSFSTLTHHRTADHVNHLVLNETTTKCFSVTLLIH